MSLSKLTKEKLWFSVAYRYASQELSQSRQSKRLKKYL